MKALMGISVLLFNLVFYSNGQTCSDKHNCDRNNNEISTRNLFTERRVERESRTVNIRGKVGSERLVNNRRIVDSDSRLANFPGRLNNMPIENSIGINTDLYVSRRFAGEIRNQNQNNQVTKRNLHSTTDDQAVRQTGSRQRSANEGRRVDTEGNRYSERRAESFRNSERLPAIENEIGEFSQLKEKFRPVVRRSNPETERFTDDKDVLDINTSHTRVQPVDRASESIRIYERGSIERNNLITGTIGDRLKNANKSVRRVTERNILDTGRFRNVITADIRSESNHAVTRLHTSKNTIGSRIVQNRFTERTSSEIERGTIEGTGDAHTIRSIMSKRLLGDSETVTNTRTTENVRSRLPSNRDENNEKNERRQVPYIARMDIRRMSRKQEDFNKDERVNVRREIVEERRQTDEMVRSRFSNMAGDGVRVFQNRSRHVPQAALINNDNNSTIYLNQEYSRFDIVWSNLLTTVVGLVLIGQVVHSNLDSKKLYRFRNIFKSTKEKIY